MADYCTHRDLIDIYPHIDEFDSKTSLYNWINLGTNLYSCQDSGQVTVLFNNGKNLSSFELSAIAASVVTTLDGAISDDTDSIIVADAGNLSAGQFIIIESEKLLITSISVNTLTVIRGILNTARASHETGLSVSEIGILLDAQNEWYYDSGDDVVYIYSTVDPSDYLMEAGEDYSVLISRYITNASRYFDSSVNSVLPTEQYKNADGTYDYIIVRTTAILACAFLIRSYSPDHPAGESLLKEGVGVIEGIIAGKIKLIKDITGDASRGTLKTITHTSGKMLPVDTRGRYSGIFDIIKIKITTAGALGVAKFTTSVSSSTSLKGTSLTPVIITGQYDVLYSGISIRFGADGESGTWTAAVDDEWELLVYGKDEMIDRPVIKSMRASRL